MWRTPNQALQWTGAKALFRCVGKNNTDRMHPDDFIALLAMVTDQK